MTPHERGARACTNERLRFRRRLLAAVTERLRARCVILRRARALSANFCDFDLAVSDRVLTLAATTILDVASAIIANNKSLRMLLVLTDIEPLARTKYEHKIRCTNHASLYGTNRLPTPSILRDLAVSEQKNFTLQLSRSG